MIIYIPKGWEILPPKKNSNHRHYHLHHFHYYHHFHHHHHPFLFEFPLPNLEELGINLPVRADAGNTPQYFGCLSGVGTVGNTPQYFGCLQVGGITQYFGKWWWEILPSI